MSTLFFEGFNQAITLQGFDSAYWSTQYAQFPKYGFISRLPWGQFANDGINSTRYSPFGSSFNPPSVSYPAYGIGQLFNTEDKSYLCLYNPNYNDGTIEPTTFIRCSGFPLPSGDKTYFSMKVYGLENNSSVHSAYPYRNKFLSFCSGNNEILTFNMVRITGNFLPQLNGVRETLGIEAIYNNNSLGTYDLNIPGIQNYDLANRQSTHNILNITRGFQDLGGFCGSILNKGYIHLEFLLDGAINNSGLFNLKVDGVDAPVINEDINIVKSNWSNQIIGSGDLFFDNFRIYNRMAYNSYIGNVVDCQGAKSTYDTDNQWIFLDDIVLIDNSGNLPNSWLGPSSKIISYKPDASAGSGLFQWTSNVTTGNIIQKTQSALYTNDGDIGYIETIDSGNVAALGFSKFTNLSTLPDGIGGIKVYNVARKESLDTQFINVFATGMNSLSNILQYDTLILNEFGKDKNDDDTITDESVYARSLVNSGCVASRDIIRNGDSSFFFPNDSSSLRFNHPFFNNNVFTLETWFYGNNIPNNFTLLGGANKDSSVDTGAYWTYSIRPSCFQFLLTPNSVNIEQIRSINNTTVKMSGVKLLLANNGLSPNNWNHIALCRNTDNSIVCYLNGQANTGHMMIGFEKNYQECSSTTFPCLNSPLSIIQYSGLPSSTSFNMTSFSSPFTSSLNNIGTNYGYIISQDTSETSGLFIAQASGYIDNYRISLGKNIYSSNFTPPSSVFLPTDYFANLGPVHNVTQSSYKTFQYYSFINPATNKNWRVSEISGMAFGVKKL